MFEDVLPWHTTGTLDKSKTVGFCTSLKLGFIKLNGTSGVYMQDKDLVTTDPKKLQGAKIMEVVDLKL